jgi:hypothetical protein
MTNEEIIEMAKFECRMHGKDFVFSDYGLIAFARLIAAKQIEIDAGICDGLAEEWKPSAEREATREDLCAELCAAAIRGQTT